MPGRRSTVASRLVCFGLLLSAAACGDEPQPLAPEAAADPDGLDGAPPPQQSFETHTVFSDRALGFPEEDFELRSSAAELGAGLYRFRPTGGEVPDVERDDFIVAPDADGTVVVRRVLRASEEGGELVLDTGPAYWHDVIRGGDYSITMPLGAGEARFTGPAGVSVPLYLDSLQLPALEATFKDTDVCQWLNDVLDLIPGAKERRVCGKEVEMEVAYGVSLAVAGTLDSLRILEGNVRLTGELDIGMTIDGGSITGGRRPTFSPCNRAAYLGCLSTPTGAALIDFLRRYAPAIPDASIPPNRVCVPGTPVRVARGYWSGFTWNPPTYERCRVTDIGELPTIVLPSVRGALNEVRPHITGDLVIRAIGDGKFTLEIPIPGAAAKAGYAVTNDFKAKAAVGLFIVIGLELKNGGGTVQVTFDDTGKVTQAWTEQVGWETAFAITDKNHHAQILQLTAPDSIVVKSGGTVKVNGEVCIALYACGKTEEDGGDPDTEFQLTILGQELFGGTGLNLGAKLGVGLSTYADMTYVREQVNPADSLIDNWRVIGEGAYSAFAQAGLHIPLTGWILPNVPRSWEGEWECCRVPVFDYWGQGRLRVTTATTGVDPDPDGYTVLVEPVDTVPDIVRPGVQVVGNPESRRILEERVGASAELIMGPDVTGAPCITLYSDAILYTNPTWGLAVAGARALGADVPTYAVTSRCRWLIAPYRVTLGDVASNCTVDGDAVRDSVWLQSQRLVNPTRLDLKDLQFDVTCTTAGAQGDMRVVLDPTARDPGAPPSVLVDGITAGVFDTDTVRLGGLAAGQHLVELQGLRAGCSADPATVDVLAGQTVEVTHTLTCTPYVPPPGTVTYVASMTGAGPDPNGYGITVDGVPSAPLPRDGRGEVLGLAPSSSTVFMVTDIAGNCQAQAPNPTVVTLDGSATPVEVPFPVECVDAPADTLVGTVDASGWPATSVTLRATDGTTLVVNGPLVDELARLTGSPVRVWGVTSATGIDAYGYDLRSQLGDDRWMGILMSRPDGLWLYGDEAIPLVNAPAALASQAGNLVWVMGQEVAGGVQPTLFGVIRGG